jgi:hypothetical protein
MGTTTNNGWPTPVATDLVKDGWEAIKDLGDAIDTTLGVYAPSTPGLTLINTTSFSGVTSQSINNVFSATYDNYRVVLSSGSNSNTANIDFRFRVSGADNSTSNYFMQRSIVNQTGSASASSNNGTTSFTLSSNTAGVPLVSHSMDILTPFANNFTHIFGSGFSDVSGFGTRFYGGAFNGSTSFTGFSLINSSGNFSGTVTVYGYNV